MTDFNSEDVFNSWNDFFKPIINSVEFNQLINFLDNQYSIHTVRPDKENVFNAFKQCPYNDLKVVILGQDPYPNSLATGLSFANPNDLNIKLSPSLLKIKECIEMNIYHGLNVSFNPSLIDWAQQGVLMLNTALTVIDKQIGSHVNVWKMFTKFVLENLNDYPNSIIYCLWGKKAQDYSKYIDLNKHLILTYHHPSYSARQGKIWNCPHFEQINNFLNNENNNNNIIW